MEYYYSWYRFKKYDSGAQLHTGYKNKTAYGLAKVHFNDASIIMDLNDELAGKTLIYNLIYNWQSKV